MWLSVLCLLAAAGAAWLSIFERTSSLALTLIELEGRFGVPLWAILAGIGVLLGLFPLARALDARKRGPSPTQRAARGLPSSVAGGDTALWERVSQLPLEPGVHLRAEPEIPVVMVLDNAPPERVRRSVERLLVFFASEAGTPPRTRIVFRQCPTAGVPRDVQVSGLLKQHFAARPDTSWRLLATDDRIDLLFSSSPSEPAA